MKAKKKMLLSSIMVIALCLSLIAGSTFALFTSESKVNIAVTSGKVDVVATLSEPSLYSVEPDANGNLEVKTGLGAGFYSYSPLSGSTFLNGGTATLSGGTLTISRITPGDKITTTLGITNKSNVTVQYRVLVTVEEEAHANTARLLTEAMVLSMQAESATKATEYTGLKTYTSAWEKISPVGAGSPDNIDDIDIALWLPVETGNDYQDLEDLSVTFTVEAVQGNASVSGVETYETVTATVENYSDFETATQTVNTTTDPVTGDTIAADTELTTTSEEANITVNVVVPSTLSFTSENDDTVTVTETSTVELQVSNVSMIADKDTAQETVSLDVKLLVDGKEVENANQAVTVTLNIGTGKDITSFTHNGEPVDNYSYSAQTGILTFTTTGFSPFEYTYSVVAPAAKIINIGDNNEKIETYFYKTDYESELKMWEAIFKKTNEGDTIYIFKGTYNEVPTSELSKYNIELLGDITVTASAGGYSKAGLLVVNGGHILNGNGYTLTVKKANGTWDCAVYTTGGTIKNITINGAFRGIFTGGLQADLIVDNVILDNVCYTLHGDGNTRSNYEVKVSNSTLNGWTSYSDIFVNVSFTNCNFGKGTGVYPYAYCRPYNASAFTNCVFEAGKFEFDASQNDGINFIDCYYGETLSTKDNCVELLGSDAGALVFPNETNNEQE